VEAAIVPFPGRDAFSLPKTADIQAVFHPGRGPVVTRGQNLLVFNEEGAHLSAQTGRSFGNQMGDVHEILFPGGPEGTNLFFLFLFQR
jgi:hypothetical protein